MTSYGRNIGSANRGNNNSREVEAFSNMSINDNSSVSEVVPVPADLVEYVSDNKFQSVLLKIKEQSGVNALFRGKNTAGNLVINVDASHSDSGVHAKQLLELMFKHQQKLQLSEDKLKKTQSDLHLTQGSIASGHIVEFDVPQEVIGLIIGKKGARIRQIEETSGVQNIKVAPPGNNTNGTARVIIVGNDNASVRRAREQMEVKQESHPVAEAHVQYFRRRDPQNPYAADNTADLRDTTGLLQIRVDTINQALVFTGTAASLRSARMLLNTYLDNIDEILAVESKQREANLELYEVKSKLGAVGGRAGPGGRGYGGAGGAGSAGGYRASDVNRGGAGGRGQGNNNSGNNGSNSNNRGNNGNNNSNSNNNAGNGKQSGSAAAVAQSAKGQGQKAANTPPPAPAKGQQKVQATNIVPPAPPAAANANGKTGGRTTNNSNKKDDAAAAAATAAAPAAAPPAAGEAAGGKKSKKAKKPEEGAAAATAAAAAPAPATDAAPKKANNKAAKPAAAAVAAADASASATAKKPNNSNNAAPKKEDKKPDEKKPADKKQADKKPADKKPDEKKQADKKPTEKKEPTNAAPAAAAAAAAVASPPPAAAAASSSATDGDAAALEKRSPRKRK